MSQILKGYTAQREDLVKPEGLDQPEQTDTEKTETMDAMNEIFIRDENEPNFVLSTECW